MSFLLQRFQKGNKPSFNVKWAKDSYNNWFSLFNTDFSTLTSGGVYIIWGIDMTNINKIIKVGQSIDLSKRLQSYNYEGDVISHLTKFGALYVTWADLPKQYLDGVENYLGHHYRPLIAGAFPDALPVEVNIPF